MTKNPIGTISTPSTHPVKFATSDKLLPPEKALAPGQAMNFISQAAPVVLGERPTVQEITAKVRMSKLTAQQIFKNIVFAEHETEVILTEVMRPAQPGELIACVHGASGQKFTISHYELDGVRI